MTSDETRPDRDALREQPWVWRANRETGWHRDIGYSLQTVLGAHRYVIEDKGSKPDDPGWHTCSCGEWEGYWSSFHPHVADHLRAVVEPALAQRDAEARAEIERWEQIAKENGRRINALMVERDEARRVIAAVEALCDGAEAEMDAGRSLGIVTTADLRAALAGDQP